MLKSDARIVTVFAPLTLLFSVVSSGILTVLCANATVGAFDKAQLICTAKGIPSGAIITVDWRRGGSTAAGGTAVIIKNDSNHLVTLQGHRTTMTIHEVGNVLRCVLQGKDDTGPYRCVVTAIGETVWETAVVFVRPHVSYLPKSITVRSGGSFRVECASWGYETPSIAWYRDGRRLTSRSPMLTSLHAVNFQSVVDDDDDDLGIRLSLSPNADGQPDGVLRIRDVRGADRATFNCSATNANGSASRSTLLRVRGKLRWLWPFISLVVELTVVSVVIVLSEVYRRRQRLRTDVVDSPSNVNVVSHGFMESRSKSDSESTHCEPLMASRSQIRVFTESEETNARTTDKPMSHMLSREAINV